MGYVEVAAGDHSAPAPAPRQVRRRRRPRRATTAPPSIAEPLPQELWQTSTSVAALLAGSATVPPSGRRPPRRICRRRSCGKRRRAVEPPSGRRPSRRICYGTCAPAVAASRSCTRTASSSGSTIAAHASVRSGCY